MTSVAICIPTHRRPEGLSLLMESLLQQTFDVEPLVEIFVVDNDPARSAEDTVVFWREKFNWPISYEVEPQPGIPFVRNKLIDCSVGFDFLAFIDDDEVASRDWLRELLKTQAKYDADVVMGPVKPLYRFEPADWIVKGRFHESGRFNDGETFSELVTWNVLIRHRLFHLHKIRFEEKMALTGGTDVLLGRLLRQHGVSFYWSSTALVHEIIPVERTSLRWLMLRRFRAGTSGILIRRFSNERHFRLKGALDALKLLATGFLKMLTSLWSGKASLVKGAGYLCQAVGTIAGILGGRYEEYRKMHN